MSIYTHMFVLILHCSYISKYKIKQRGLMLSFQVYVTNIWNWVFINKKLNGGGLFECQKLLVWALPYRFHVTNNMIYSV